MKILNIRVFATLFLTFGVTLNAYAWTRVENFNEGPDGVSVQKVGAMDDAAGGTLHSLDRAIGDGFSANMRISEGETGFGSWGGILSFPEPLRSGDELWVQFYMYVPNAFVVDTPRNGSLKFVRIRTVTADGSNGGFNDFQIVDDDTISDAVYRYIKEGYGGPGWLEIGPASERSRLFPRERWFKVELAFSFGTTSLSEGGRSYVRFWLNDELVWNGVRAQTLSNPADIADALYLFTYWNGSSPKSQELFVDELIMTSETPKNRDAFGFPYIGDRGLFDLDHESSRWPPSQVEELRVE
jgi:hypothetical protein